MTGHVCDPGLIADYVTEPRSPSRNIGYTRGPISDCKFCGRSHKRNKDSCPAYGRFCPGYGKRNQIIKKYNMQKLPSKRDTFPNAKIHAVNEETTSGAEEILIVDISPQNNLEINTVSQSPVNNKIFASMLIRGREISFQLDSGATCNVLPEHFVPPATTVKTSDHSLHLYGKALLARKGICKLKVTNPKTQIDYTVIHYCERRLCAIVRSQYCAENGNDCVMTVIDCKSC